MKALAGALPLPALIALGTLAALSFARAAAAAESQQETRAVAGFHRIEIEGKADVTLIQGEAESVTIEAPAASLARIRTTVRDGTLVVDAAESRSLWSWLLGGGVSRTPRVTIRLRSVDRIEASGAVTLDADRLSGEDFFLDLSGACTLRIRDLQATSLRIDGSGATKVSLGGRVTRQKVDLSGAGSYQAEKLASDEAAVEVSGAGKAVVNAAKSLAVDISGAGKIEYLGEPKLRQSISGIGKVTRREGS
jgi:Putative auto-transporter adhesin, head GIN domain